MWLFLAFMGLLCNPVVQYSCASLLSLWSVAVWWVSCVCCSVVLSVDVAGFSLRSSYADKHEQPNCCAVAQHAAVWVFSPKPHCVYWKTAKKAPHIHVGSCARVWVLCLSLFIYRMHPMCLHTGWSVLIILKLLHNAVKHYNYHELNIQNTHWRICGLGILSSYGVLEMMGLGDVWRETGTEMISRETVNQLGKETQGKNKAWRKCTCQTEQQPLASSSVSYVIAPWSADLQVRRGKRECYGKAHAHTCTQNIEIKIVLTM